MNNYKICVYAICKNEEKFIDRWAKSVAEADYIVVLDTGSTDKSYELLQNNPQIHAYQEIISPWRFDTARNKALSYVPRDIDICISLDLDEVLTPGWHHKICSAWYKKTTAATCREIWNFTKDGKEDGTFWPIRIHSRNLYTWQHAIHEVLMYKGTTLPSLITLKGVEIHHHPDLDKKRDYLTMLKETVARHPDEPHDLFYLGREYLFHKDYQEAIDTLTHYLSLSPFKEERCNALCFMAKAYVELRQYNEAIKILEKAHMESPTIREPLVDLAYIYYYKNNWEKVTDCIDKVLKIKNNPKGFVSQGYAWDATPYDLASFAYYRLGHYDAALACAITCLYYEPTSERFIANYHRLQRMVISSICSLPITK